MWCEKRGLRSGQVVSVERVWRLGERWYADRLDPEWRPKTVEAMEAIFNDVGLTVPFWGVR